MLKYNKIKEEKGITRSRFENDLLFKMIFYLFVSNNMNLNIY